MLCQAFIASMSLVYFSQSLPFLTIVVFLQRYYVSDYFV